MPSVYLPISLLIAILTVSSTSAPLTHDAPSNHTESPLGWYDPPQLQCQPTATPDYRDAHEKLVYYVADYVCHHMADHFNLENHYTLRGAVHVKSTLLGHIKMENFNDPMLGLKARDVAEVESQARTGHGVKPGDDDIYYFEIAPTMYDVALAPNYTLTPPGDDPNGCTTMTFNAWKDCK